MNEKDAQALAETIKQQFPFHFVALYRRSDKLSWYISIREREDSERSLSIRDASEWERILFAVQLLRD